jgi:hypothetical protein
MSILPRKEEMAYGAEFLHKSSAGSSRLGIPRDWLRSTNCAVNARKHIRAWTNSHLTGSRDLEGSQAASMVSVASRSDLLRL